MTKNKQKGDLIALMEMDAEVYLHFLQMQIINSSADAIPVLDFQLLPFKIDMVQTLENTMLKTNVQLKLAYFNP